MNKNIAILDAPLAHGASRQLRERSQESPYSLRGHHNPSEDRLLFLEFLHVLLLYDEILLDDSCGAESGADVKALFELVNSALNFDLLQRRCVATTSFLDPVIHRICAVIEAIPRDHSSQRANMLALPIPWAYSSRRHHDYELFREVAARTGLDGELLPFALFCFRGLCYAGYANNLARTKEMPVAYLASHGRLSALRLILDQAEVRRFHYAKRAYADLLDLLKLPDGGYDFSDFSSLYPPDFSALTVAVSSLTPAEALSYVLRLRSASAGAALRQQWSERLWSQSQAVAIGPGYSPNSSSGVAHHGMIRASALDTSSYEAFPSTAAVRRLLEQVLVGDSDLDAFCIDHFPEAKRQFSSAMPRMAKLNILLEREDAAQIVAYLREDHPEAVGRYEQILKGVGSHTKDRRAGIRNGDGLQQLKFKEPGKLGS